MILSRSTAASTPAGSKSSWSTTAPPPPSVRSASGPAACESAVHTSCRAPRSCGQGVPGSALTWANVVQIAWGRPVEPPVWRIQHTSSGRAAPGSGSADSRPASSSRSRPLTLGPASTPAGPSVSTCSTGAPAASPAACRARRGGATSALVSTSRTSAACKAADSPASRWVTRQPRRWAA